MKKKRDPLLCNLVIMLGGVSVHLFTRYSLILVAHCKWKNDYSGTLKFYDKRVILRCHFVSDASLYCLILGE